MSLRWSTIANEEYEQIRFDDALINPELISCKRNSEISIMCCIKKLQLNLLTE